MGSNAHSAVQHFQRLRRQTHVHLLVHQRVGHAVVVPFDFDVIVEVHAGRLPFPKLVTGGRQRLQRRPVQLCEQRGAATLPLAEPPLVEPREQLGDRLVHLLQRKEFAFAQCSHDPTLDYLNAYLHFGFVPGPIGSRRNDRHTVVFSQVSIGWDSDPARNNWDG